MTVNNPKHMESTYNFYNNDEQEVALDMSMSNHKRKNTELVNQLALPQKRKKELHNAGKSEDSKNINEGLFKDAEPRLHCKTNSSNKFIKLNTYMQKDHQELSIASCENTSKTNEHISNSANTCSVILNKAIGIKCSLNILTFKSSRLELWIQDFIDNFNKTLNFTWDLTGVNQTIAGIDQFTSFFSNKLENSTQFIFKLNKECFILECFIPELIPLIYYLNINKYKSRN